MISISDSLKEIISRYPLIEEGLSRGIINYSAFAREVKPQIEKRLYKTVKESAIVMSLKRISDGLPKKRSIRKSLNLTDLTVKSNLTEYTFTNSGSLADKQRKLFNQMAGKKDVFCAVSQGIRETTFITSAEASLAMEKIFAAETRIAKIAHLSSITIHLPEETVETPGIYYQILKMLAWNKINIVEVISTYTELTIVLNNKDVDRAFSVLNCPDNF